ncbi:unnamed protein product [Albugo candida]|uniref:Uncharacterized protein n=1 Tax=Albugo candida TaxID=65357 RepID=A0A024FWC5_9STRA|nr:unnamed protein product [Albugo candida]|eukprot:CCI11222.1 unnamed protein product [Albugo candida]
MVLRLLEQIISRLLADKTRSRACTNVAMLPSELSSTFKYVIVEYGTPSVFEHWMKAILSKRKLSFSSLYDALKRQKMQILNFSTCVILLKSQEERKERIALGHVGLRKSDSSATSRGIANIFFPGNFFVLVTDCLHIALRKRTRALVGTLRLSEASNPFQRELIRAGWQDAYACTESRSLRCVQNVHSPPQSHFLSNATSIDA